MCICICYKTKTIHAAMFKINFFAIWYLISLLEIIQIWKKQQDWSNHSHLMTTNWLNWMKLPLLDSPLGCLITGVCAVDRYEMEGSSFEKNIFDMKSQW